MVTSRVILKLYDDISLYSLIYYIRISANLRIVWVFIVLGLTLKLLFLFTTHFDCTNIFLSFSCKIDAYNVFDDHILQSRRGIRISDLLNPDTSSPGNAGGGSGGPNPGGGPNTNLASGGRLTTEGSRDDSDTAAPATAFRQPASDEYVSGQERWNVFHAMAGKRDHKLSEILTNDQLFTVRKMVKYDYFNAPGTKEFYLTHFASGDIEKMGNVKLNLNLRAILNKYPLL